MAVSFKMNVKINDEEARKMLKNFENIDFRKPMKQSGVYMERAIGQRFRKADWKRLSRATMKIHPRRKGGKPLNDTGKLRMSVTSRAFKRVTKNKLEYGTNLKYAPLHNFGGRGGWGRTIPKREFLYFDDRDEEIILRIFEDYLRELAK
jgi:phage gpG-like protein